uniref:Putative transposase n=1 Tax=Ixodes scapularis TaxID=6945 RepID=A0A4D5RUX0_IXOSC
MKVKRATQVLSSSVCVALLALVYARQLPEAAMSTAYVCDRMDKLFDCLNSSRPKKSEQKLRYAIRNGDTEIVDFLCNQLPWVAAWKFEGRRQPQTVTGWQVTIRAVLMLWEDISEKYNFSFLLTRRLQQDALENIFWQMRQQHGCNTNPNVYQFTCGLKHIGIRKLLKLSEKGNVENDNTNLPQEMSPFSLETTSIADSVECAPVDDFPPLDDISELVSSKDSNIIDDLATYYVAGFLIKLFLEKSSQGCLCSGSLREGSDNLNWPHQYFTTLKAFHYPGKMFGN